MPISAPSDLANLTLWLEAQSLTTLADGDPVAEWTEAGLVTGNSDETFPTDSPQNPATYQTNVLCGQPVLHFDWSGVVGDDAAAYEPTNRLFYAATGVTALITSGAFTGFSLFRVISLESGKKAQAWGGNAAGFLIGVFVRNTGGTYELVVINYDGSTQAELTWPYTPGEWVYVEAWQESGTLYGQVNGADLQSVTSGAYPFNPDYEIGLLETYTATPEMEIALLGMYDRALTESERNQLRCEYVAGEYPCLELGGCCDPEPITSVGPTLWVEADSVTGLSSGDELHVWPESGAIAIDGTDDLTDYLGDPPLWSTDGPCGMPVVQFRGNTLDQLGTPDDGRRGENLVNTIPANLELHPAGEFTVIAVGRVSDFGTTAPPEVIRFALWFAFSNQLQLRRHADGSTVVYLDIITDSSGAGVNLEVPYMEGDWVCVELWGEGGYPSGTYPRPDQPGTIHLRVNGGSEVSAPWAGFRFAENEGMGWAEVGTGTSGELAEMWGQWIFPRALTEAERDAFRTEYLACRLPCLDFGGGAGPGLFSWVFACC